MGAVCSTVADRREGISLSDRAGYYIVYPAVLALECFLVNGGIEVANYVRGDNKK